MDVIERTEEISKDVYGLAKPKLRGVVHALAIVPVALAGLLLTLSASTATAQVAVAIYTLSITGMLAASAAYHRLRVSDVARVWLRRIDHSMIGVAVAGTYTPVVTLVSDGFMRAAFLAILWLGAVGGLALTVGWPQGPRWVRAALYVCLGWVGVFIIPPMMDEAEVASVVLALLGGLFYSAGAIVYALRRPNPSPLYFGFHEVFHTLVVVAVVCHFGAVAVVVSRAA